VILKYCM